MTIRSSKPLIITKKGATYTTPGGKTFRSPVRLFVALMSKKG